MTTVDVLLISRASLRYRQELVEREPPLTKAFEISPGIHLAAVKEDIARPVFYGCKFRDLEPGGDAVLYGFVRYNPPGRRWDEDQAISKALYLSHFIHAHEGGFEFAARIETDEGDRLIKVEPAHIVPPFARAYPCAGVERRWLRQAEAEELRNLIIAYDAARDYLKDKRVGMAVSLFSESPFIFHGRPRAALLAAALEGLVSTSAERAFKQFTVRVPALAAEVGLPQFDKAWAERMYKLRSKLAHGVPLLQAVDDEEIRRRRGDLETAMTEMDEILRQLLKRALLDRTFAERIQNAETHWPVAGKGCPACRAQNPNLIDIQCPTCGARWQ